MSNTPQIRFAGFTDAWEQRKLSDLLEENLIPVPKPNGEYTRLGIRSHAKGTFHEVVAEGEGLDVDTMYVVEADNLIVNITFAWEEAWAITTEKDAEKLVSHRFPQYRFHQGQYPMFYQYRFRNGRMKYNLELASPGGAGRNRVLNKTEFMKIPVEIPTSYEEEKKIGDFFSNLDTLITLHQRKCDTLQKFKKSMLQKMFPQNGETVPEIRFAGFTDAWEQRKLGDKMYIKSRIGWQALTKDEYLDTGDYYLITGTDIDETTHTVDLSRCYYVSKERYDMDDKIQVHEGDIIITKDGTIGKVAMVSGLDKPATLNSHLFVLRDLSGTLNNRFLLQVLNSHIFDSFVESTKTGSTLTGLPQKTFVEFMFYAPRYEEQKKISNYLDNLDTLITLHQRKLETLQKMKKSLLQKMFP